MRNFFSFLTIGLIVIGFICPIAWAGAFISGILAMASSPPGKRPDGKKKTGGLFGGMIDNYQIKNTMKDCPFCKSKIMKDATKCPNCRSTIKVKPNYIFYN